MPAFENSEEIQAALELAIDRERLAALPIRVGKNGSGGLELRIEFSTDKVIFPIRWTPHPKRATFADPEKRRQSPEIVVAPHIAEPLAKDLRQWSVNHADLNGRLFIVQTGILIIDREPRGTQYKNPEPNPKLFAGKAARICRILLSKRDQHWTQEEIKVLTRNSPGYVSRILKALEEAGYVRKDASGSRAAPARYHAADFDALLDAWVQEDDFRKRVEIYEYSILADYPEKIASETRDAIGANQIAFTQWFAAWERKSHTTPSVVSGYVRKDVPQRFKLGRRVDSGGNLWLLVPKDEGVFQATQIVREFLCVSDAQIYLDLINAGLRGPEAAQELRKSDTFAQ